MERARKLPGEPEIDTRSAEAYRESLRQWLTFVGEYAEQFASGLRR